MRWSPANPTPTSPGPAGRNPPGAGPRLRRSPPPGRPAQPPPDRPQLEGRPPGPGCSEPCSGVPWAPTPCRSRAPSPGTKLATRPPPRSGPSPPSPSSPAPRSVVSARSVAQAGSASTAPRRPSSSVAVVAVRVVASAAVGSGPVEQHMPAAAAVRPASKRAPLTVARAPVIDTVPVTRSWGTSSTVPRVTGGDRQLTGAEVARPGRRPAPTGETGARGVPLPASVALPEAGVGVPDPAPTLLLLPGGAGSPGLAGAASQGARSHPMLYSPGMAPVAVEVAPPELPGIEARHPLDRVQPLHTQLRLQRIVHRAEAPGHHVVPVGEKPRPIASHGTSMEVPRVEHMHTALRVVQIPARLARRTVEPGPLQRVPAKEEVERSVRVPGTEAAGARPPQDGNGRRLPTVQPARAPPTRSSRSSK